MDDSTLIRRAQAGDAAAFEALLNTYYDMIFRFAYKWCGSRVDAEDITQQACIKLARSLVQFRFESAFSSWLYRLVINCAKDWFKSQQRFHGDEFAGAEESASGDQDAEIRIYLHQILRLLETMAEGFKETALLVYAEGLTHAEAATILGVKETTVSWRLHEIRKQLKFLGDSSSVSEPDSLKKTVNPLSQLGPEGAAP
jgi:RNA polymerase sigma-70 factor (ECF subfamily)